jgi:phosphatidylserine/phosphatidylglycerophosphate/cardiolipin synthase-like enzyme
VRSSTGGLTELPGAARRGGHVRVLVEAYGSDTLRQDYFEPLIATGGELRCFNPGCGTRVR